MTETDSGLASSEKATASAPLDWELLEMFYLNRSSRTTAARFASRNWGPKEIDGADKWKGRDGSSSSLQENGLM